MSAMLVGWLTMFVMVASPGPSVFAIMGTSLAHGRAAGVKFAAGVCTGSIFWGVVTTAGFGFLLQIAWVLTILKIVGAAYLIWLAIKTMRSAMSRQTITSKVPRGGFYAVGLGLHLTNPKAVFGWAATVAIGLPHGGGTSDAVLFLSGCALMALIVNFGYALAFSTESVIRVYRRISRWVQGTFAAVFAAAGIGLLAWRP